MSWVRRSESYSALRKCVEITVDISLEYLLGSWWVESHGSYLVASEQLGPNLNNETAGHACAPFMYNIQYYFTGGGRSKLFLLYKVLEISKQVFNSWSTACYCETQPVLLLWKGFCYQFKFIKITFNVWRIDPKTLPGGWLRW